MAHEILEYRDRHVTVRDLDLWAIRHFLLAEAERSDDPELAAFIQGWIWIGVGVFTGIDFDSFLDGDLGTTRRFLNLIDAARTRLESFGESVPLDYLAAYVNLPGASFTAAQPVARLAQQLEKLKSLLAADRPA